MGVYIFFVFANYAEEPTKKINFFFKDSETNLLSVPMPELQCTVYILEEFVFSSTKNLQTNFPTSQDVNVKSSGNYS